MTIRPGLLPLLLRMILLVMKWKRKYFNLKCQLIICDMFVNLVFASFDPLIKLSNKLLIAKFDKSFEEIESFIIFNPNMKVFRKKNFFRNINFCLLNHSPDQRFYLSLLILKLILLSFQRFEITLS